MSSWVVRRAEPNDIPWWLTQVEEMLEFMGGAVPFHEAQIREVLFALIQGESLIVECDGTQAGVMAGVIKPHTLNPEVKAFNEVMWWVASAYRNTRAGLLLLNAMEEQLKEAGVQLSVMVTEANSPLSGRALLKRGYRPQELSWIKRM
jgi:hypothetical protein